MKEDVLSLSPEASFEVRSVVINGREYALGRVKLPDLDPLVAWANARLDARGRSRRPLRSLVRSWFQDAVPQRPFEDPAVTAELLSANGIRELFWVCLRQAHPGMTRRESDDLAGQLNLIQVAMVAAAAFRSED